MSGNEKGKSSLDSPVYEYIQVLTNYYAYKGFIPLCNKLTWVFVLCGA